MVTDTRCVPVQYVKQGKLCVFHHHVDLSENKIVV